MVNGTTRTGALVIGALIAAFANGLVAQRFPERPAQRVFVLDIADLIDADDEAAIQTRCDRLLTDKKVPLKVVTIRRLAEYGADDIERFARALFDDWGIGFPNANYGILVLVSKADRRARIEMGHDWSNTGDDAAEAVMRGLMASFREGRFSSGLATAAAELDAFARGKQPPKRSSGRVRWEALAGVLVPIVIFVIAAIFGLQNRGGGGPPTPPLGRGGPFSARNRFSRSSAMPNALGGGGGGGFGGGSFGGGFGGGGGATGGW